MSRPLFTPEELAELAAADAELDESFVQTQEEIEQSRKRDRESKLDRIDNRKKALAAQRAAYREANRDKIAAQRAAYYEANKDKIAARQAAWFKNNREKWNAYQRERRRMKKEEASGCLS